MTRPYNAAALCQSCNRSRLIVVGQDGAGKSCLVDSLLNRPFESVKASTEGAAVTMSCTTVSGWKATNRKEHLDSLVAEGCYSSNLQQSVIKESPHAADMIDPESQPEEAQETGSSFEAKSISPAEEVGIEAKMLTRNQEILVSRFLAEKPSVEDLSEQTLGVRDIWDLGGQEVYLATHSALMPNTFGLSIYMVVMDISKSLSATAESFHRSTDGEIIKLPNDLGWIRKNEDFPLYWFGSITAAHQETERGDCWLGEDEEVNPPPVFAIGSHRDIVENDKKIDSAAARQWLRQQGKRFEELLKNSDFVRHIVLPKRGERNDDEDFREMSHFIERIFLIDNSVSGSGSPCRTVEEIRRRVDRMASTYCRRIQKQPLFWVYLEILLFRWHKDMKTVVATVDKIADIAQRPDICAITSRGEILAALMYLANVGAILYYPDVDGLQDIVFTSPTWVIKALSAFVTAAKPGPNIEPEWIRLKEKGIMSSKLMKYRLKQMRQVANSFGDAAGSSEDDNAEVIENEKKLIVQLLQHLDVIAPLAESSPNEFYVPSMLRKSFFYSTTCWEEHAYSSLFPAPLIVIPKKQKFVPECLYFRLVTRFLKLYSEKPRLSRHHCIFLADDEESPVRGTLFLASHLYVMFPVLIFLVEVELLYQSRGKWIALTIRFINKEDQNNMSATFLASIKNEFLRQMKSICQQGMRGFKYSICCQIRKAVNSGNECGIDLSSLPVIYSDEDEYCPNLPRLFNPFDEPLATNPDDLFQINFWFGQLPHQLCPIVQNVPSVSQINDLAYEIRERWTQVAYWLKPEPFSHSDVECIKYKSPRDLRNQSQSMLDAWMSKFGSKATIPVLCEALIKAELRNQAERVFTKSVVDKCVSSLP